MTDRSRQFLEFLRVNGVMPRSAGPVGRRADRSGEPPRTPQYVSRPDLHTRGVAGRPDLQTRQYAAPMPVPTRSPSAPATPEEIAYQASISTPMSYPTAETYRLINDPELVRQVTENKPLGPIPLPGVETIRQGAGDIAAVPAWGVKRVGPAPIVQSAVDWGKDFHAAGQAFAKNPTKETGSAYVQSIFEPMTGGSGDSLGGQRHIKLMGDAVYSFVTTGKETTYDRWSPDYLIVRWAKENPAYWPLFTEVYENGYGQKADGSPKWYGAEALWRFMMNDPAFVGTGFEAWLTRSVAEYIANPLPYHALMNRGWGFTKGWIG